MVVYLNGRDDWFKHHVITDPSRCTINKDLERLECGRFVESALAAFIILGSPKDAGDFNFELAIGDQDGSTLKYPDNNMLTWSEAVIP